MPSPNGKTHHATTVSNNISLRTSCYDFLWLSVSKLLVLPFSVWHSWTPWEKLCTFMQSKSLSIISTKLAVPSVEFHLWYRSSHFILSKKGWFMMSLASAIDPIRCIGSFFSSPENCSFTCKRDLLVKQEQGGRIEGRGKEGEGVYRESLGPSQSAGEHLRPIHSMPG